MKRLEVLIVGAGFSGLGMGIKLKEAGIESFEILEKASDIGGTWNENRYPGCACDIPSHLYSFSFDANPQWSRMWSGREEIHSYLKESAGRHGLMPHIRLGTRVVEAVWDDVASVWTVTLGDGSTVQSRVLVSGMGPLHVPHYPELAGLERFRGEAFHSAAWPSGVDLTGKKVGVIGTGASAIQFVPEIAPLCEKLSLFQRTPAWILPRVNFEFRDKWRRRFERIPGLMRLFRSFIFWQHEMFVFGFLGNRTLRRLGEKQALKHLASQVDDPSLRAALTPSYELGCKRVLASNTFYPALTRPNAELVTAGISEVREHSVVTADGREHPVDVLIYGTGFVVTEPFRHTRVVGRGGVEIHDAWRERPNAYLGMTVAGFPNFFMLLGPNTGLGHNSVILMIEAQIRHVVGCLKRLAGSGKRVIEVREDVQRRFAEEVRRRLAPTVWQSGGCRSWYQIGETGENPTIWPGSVIDYRRRTRGVAEADYLFR